MLILNRNKGESIFINGKQIVITFVGFYKSDEVKLAVHAPREIKIRRYDLPIVDILPEITYKRKKFKE